MLWSTLAGLAERGHDLTLVAPISHRESSKSDAVASLAGICVPRLVPVETRTHLATLLRGLLRRRPLSIERHGHHVLRHEVEKLLAREHWDVVHAEQLQALSHSRPARSRGVPVVLRAQNVESDLWRGAMALAPWSTAGAWEAKRLAEWEGRAVARVAATVALTAADAARLAELAGGRGRLEVVPAPFPVQLPPADAPLPGAPALVLFGSAGWSPNRDAIRHFGEWLWPKVRAARPGAHLYVLGDWHPSLEGANVTRWPACPDSRQAFAPGSILLLPLRFASGVRMRILEAWARGVPVVASREAAAGMEVEHGRELLLANSPEEVLSAIDRLGNEPHLAEQLTSAGRALLARRHDPKAAARQLEEIYLRVRAGVSPISR